MVDELKLFELGYRYFRDVESFLLYISILDLLSMTWLRWTIESAIVPSYIDHNYMYISTS